MFQRVEIPKLQNENDCLQLASIFIDDAEVI